MSKITRGTSHHGVIYQQAKSAVIEWWIVLPYVAHWKLETKRGVQQLSASAVRSTAYPLLDKGGKLVHGTCHQSVWEVTCPDVRVLINQNAPLRAAVQIDSFALNWILSVTGSVVQCAIVEWTFSTAAGMCECARLPQGLLSATANWVAGPACIELQAAAYTVSPVGTWQHVVWRIPYEKIMCPDKNIRKA